MKLLENGIKSNDDYSVKSGRNIYAVNIRDKK